MVYPFARYTLLPFIRFFIKKTVGIEHVPMHGPYIIACKHFASLDGVFVAATLTPYLNQKIYYVANVAQWGWFWEKIVSERWAGAIPFYKDNPSACLDVANAYLRRGCIVGIFPEGFVEQRQKNQKAKTGTARLALWNKVPIVPIGLKHTITTRFANGMHKRRNAIKNILTHPHSLEIHIGQPFTLEKFYDQPITKELLYEATIEVMSHIESLSELKRGVSEEPTF